MKAAKILSLGAAMTLLLTFAADANAQHNASWKGMGLPRTTAPVSDYIGSRSVVDDGFGPADYADLYQRRPAYGYGYARPMYAQPYYAPAYQPGVTIAAAPRVGRYDRQMFSYQPGPRADDARRTFSYQPDEGGAPSKGPYQGPMQAPMKGPAQAPQK